MSSRARKNKTYKPQENSFFHREHRSRKNRKPFFDKAVNDFLKDKILKIKIKDLEDVEENFTVY